MFNVECEMLNGETMLKVRRPVVSGSALLALLALMSFPQLLFASDQSRAKDIIQQTCVQCHRLVGQN